MEGATEQTLKHKRKELGAFARWLESESRMQRLEDLSPRDILDHLEWMRLRGLSPVSVNTRMRSIRAWCNTMMAWEFLTVNPCAKIKSPKMPKREKPFINPEDIQKLLNLCPLSTLSGSRHASMVWLLSTTGMRRNELLSLNKADLDWDKGLIRVIQGKGQKERFVPFARDAQKVVLRYLANRQDNFECLWVTEFKKPLSWHGLGQAMQRLFQRAGVAVVDPCHAFRRTFAANAVRQGIPRPYVQAVCGWSTPQMMDRYIAAMKSEDDAIDAFEGFKPFG